MDGALVPGVTTVLNVLAKPALVGWANRLGLKGYDVRSYVDELARIGTLAHAMVMADLTQTDCDTSENSAHEIDRAENALLSYYNWKQGKSIEPILIEVPLVSESHRYGGTPDIVAVVDGMVTLVDVKTSRALYPEHAYQLAAYRHLVEAHLDRELGDARILRIGRTENEGFEERVYTCLERQWAIFGTCLDLYRLRKQEQT